MKYNTISLSSLCLLHFCYDSKNVNSPSVLIDFHQRKLEKKCLEKNAFVQYLQLCAFD